MTQYQTEWARKRRKTDPSFNKKSAAAVKKYSDRNRDKVRLAVRRSYFKRVHGMTPEQRKAELEKRDHRCDICEDQRLDKKSLSLDHDRTCCPGRKSCEKCRRGFVCDRCNLALGLMQDSEERLRKMLKYLRYWKGRRVRRS